MEQVIWETIPMILWLGFAWQEKEFVFHKALQ